MLSFLKNIFLPIKKVTSDGTFKYHLVTGLSNVNTIVCRFDVKKRPTVVILGYLLAGIIHTVDFKTRLPDRRRTFLYVDNNHLLRWLNY